VLDGRLDCALPNRFDLPFVYSPSIDAIKSSLLAQAVLVVVHRSNSGSARSCYFSEKVVRAIEEAKTYDNFRRILFAMVQVSIMYFLAFSHSSSYIPLCLTQAYKYQTGMPTDGTRYNLWDMASIVGGSDLALAAAGRIPVSTLLEKVRDSLLRRYGLSGTAPLARTFQAFSSLDGKEGLSRKELDDCL